MWPSVRRWLERSPWPRCGSGPPESRIRLRSPREPQHLHLVVRAPPRGAASDGGSYQRGVVTRTTTSGVALRLQVTRVGTAPSYQLGDPRPEMLVQPADLLVAQGDRQPGGRQSGPPEDL